MLLFGHFQYGERSLIRHRAVEEDSMEDHSLHGTKDSFRQVLRGYAVNEGGSENLRITSSTRSQKFFGPGEVIQRIRIPVYSGESIEVALLKLETARRNSAGRFASENLIQHLQRILAYEQTGQILTTRNVDSILGGALGDFMAAVEEYSTRPVKRVSAADRPRLEEIKEWGQSTEIQLVEMAITDHTLGITEFEAIKVEVEQIVPTDRRELFSWKFFGHILNAPLDSDTFQYPPVGRERSPADRIKQNWFRRTNSTVRITAAKVLTPG